MLASPVELNESAYHVARNRPFIDGNKRTAYVALETFLTLNGCAFPVTDAEAVVATLAMVAGEMPNGDFIAWVRDNSLRTLTD